MIFSRKYFAISDCKMLFKQIIGKEKLVFFTNRRFVNISNYEQT